MGIEYGKYSNTSTQRFETATGGIHVGSNLKLELCTV